ncbi:MAG: MFS transporter [Candidatus Sumerlaeia bacterium]|nr:MFS transporter [Candidatus Sumerlaeia bacterium]
MDSPTPAGAPGSLVTIPNSPWRLAAAMGALFITTGVFLPFLPVYARSHGIGASGTALLLGMIPLATIACAQYLGYLADMFFTRTRLIIVSAVVCFAIAWLFPLVPPTTAWLAALTLLYTAMCAARMSMMNSIVLASHRGDERYGAIRIAGSVTFTVVIFAVGWLVDQPWARIEYVFPVLAFGELAIWLAAAGLRDLPPAERLANAPPRIGFREAQRRLLSHPVLRPFYVFTLATQLSAYAGHQMQVRLLQEMDESALVSTASLAIGAIAEIAIFAASAWIFRRFPLIRLMAVGAAALSLRWALVWLFPSAAVVLASNVLHMLTFGLAFLTGILFVNRMSPPELKSSGLTMFGMFFFSLPALVGSAVSVLVLRWVSIFDFYGLMSLAALAALATVPPLARAWDEYCRISMQVPRMEMLGRVA